MLYALRVASVLEEPGLSTGPAATETRCTAVVVSYNSASELPACLEALASQNGVQLQVEVVDNASRDGSADLVRRFHPTVRVTETGANLGFARANNIVLDQTDAPFVALVNPDALLPPEAISTCIAALQENPRLAIAGTRLVHEDGTLQPSCHAFLDLWNLLGETLLLDRAFPTWHSLSSLHMRDFAHDERREVDWIQGAFLVVRTDAIRAVGAFDPDYFMYGEEMDLCYRLHRAGWKTVFLPAPPVVHFGGASSRPIAGPMFVEVLKSRVRFLSKHRGPVAVLLGRVIIGLSVLWRAAARWMQSLLVRLGGRPLPEPLALRVRMFSAAAAWVLRGLPLDPYRPETR